MEQNKSQKENILNVPNALTFSRIIITFLIVFFIFADFPISYIVIAFVVGMLTDFFDGQIARRFNQKTEFGRQFDMVADRFLMILVALSAMIKLSIMGALSHSQIFQIFLVVSREIVASPIIFAAMVFGKGIPIPQVRFIGKFTTTLQAITFPMILLGIYYDFFRISIYFAVLTSLIGIVSGFYFIHDVRKLMYKN